MGALRAAELWPFCTLGVGWVFTFCDHRRRRGAIVPARPTRGTGYRASCWPTPRDPDRRDAAGEKDIYGALSGGEPSYKPSESDLSHVQDCR